MKKRNIGLVMLFSLITLGIYELYWLVITKNEMNRRGQNIPSVLYAFGPLLGLLLVAVLQLFVHLLDVNDSGSFIITIVNIFSAVIGVVSVIAIIPAAIYWIFKYCKAVEVVTGGNFGFGLNIGLWLALNLVSVYFIWPGIVQDYFNKVETPEHPQHPHPHQGHPQTHHPTHSTTSVLASLTLSELWQRPAHRRSRPAWGRTLNPELL